MSAVGQIDSGTLANSVYNGSRTNQTDQTKKASSQYGNTVGSPSLSEGAAKYYEELKSKYSDMEFVLVSSDKNDQAEALAAKYANPNKTVVLIDEDRVEQMASDETEREKYEGIISEANSKLDELADSLEKSGMSGNVVGYGIQVKDDGTTSYFAVLKDSSNAQKARIEKQAEQKREAKKAAEKQAQKKQQEKAIEERRKASREEGPQRPGREDGVRGIDDEGMKLGRGISETDGRKGLTTVSANSIEELMQKVTDDTITRMSDNIRTPQEMQVGQHFDMKW